MCLNFIKEARLRTEPVGNLRKTGCFGFIQNHFPGLYQLIGWDCAIYGTWSWVDFDFSCGDSSGTFWLLLKPNWYRWTLDQLEWNDWRADSNGLPWQPNKKRDNPELRHADSKVFRICIMQHDGVGVLHKSRIFISDFDFQCWGWIRAKRLLPNRLLGLRGEMLPCRRIGPDGGDNAFCQLFRVNRQYFDCNPLFTELWTVDPVRHSGSSGHLHFKGVQDENE